MAEGGYSEDSLETKDDEEKTINVPPGVNKDKQDALFEQRKKDKDCPIAPHSEKVTTTAFKTKPNLKFTRKEEAKLEVDRLTSYVDQEAAELKSVQEDHDKLVAEKDSLLLVLQSSKSRVKV